MPFVKSRKDFYKYVSRAIGPVELGRAIFTKGSAITGAVPGLNMFPGLSCNPAAGCNPLCEAFRPERACFGLKSLIWPEVRAAWLKNYVSFSERPGQFCRDALAGIRDLSSASGLFRWLNVGGVPGIAFLRDLVWPAAVYRPDLKFLLYSKRYTWIAYMVARFGRPDNLALYLSSWPGLELFNPYRLPVAWYYDPADPDPRIEAARSSGRAIVECPGRCAADRKSFPVCRLCYVNRDKDLLFHEHTSSAKDKGGQQREKYLARSSGGSSSRTRGRAATAI